MIKLPKEVVKDLVEKLELLVKKRDNSYTPEQALQINQNNILYQNKINEKNIAMETLKKEIAELENLIVPEVLEGEDFQEEIDNIVDMLVLSGFYKRDIRPDGEYLEETGAYELEEPEEIIEEETITDIQDIEHISEIEPKEEL